MRLMSLLPSPVDRKGPLSRFTVPVILPLSFTRLAIYPFIYPCLFPSRYLSISSFADLFLISPPSRSALSHLSAATNADLLSLRKRLQVGL
jgi:hypothetical protein